MRLLFLIASACSAQTLTVPDITLNAAGQAALVRWVAQQSTRIESPLLSGITAGATSLTVGVAAWQPPINTHIGVNDEIMLVTAKSGSVLTVTRGRAGTTAVAHSAGALVRELRYQSAGEAVKAIIVNFLRGQLMNDAAINADVKTAQDAREAAINGAVR